MNTRQSHLRQAVEEKSFRGDVLVRLGGLTVQVPPLRARVEEVPALFGKLVEQHRGTVAPPRLDPLLIERLCAHDWPFNVRELALLARRLLALHPDAAVLNAACFPASCARKERGDALDQSSLSLIT